MHDPHDVYFSADVETDGPIPGRYSMTSFGLALAGRFDGKTFERTDPRAQTFYRELQPISEAADLETARISGLDRDQLTRTGTTPEIAMTDAADWIRGVAGPGHRGGRGAISSTLVSSLQARVCTSSAPSIR